MTEALLAVGDTLLVLAAVALIIFTASYAVFFNWRKTPAGRAVMGLVTMLIVIFVYNLITVALGGEFPGREWVRIAIYGTFLVAACRMVFTLWRSWSRTPTIEPK